MSLNNRKPIIIVAGHAKTKLSKSSSVSYNMEDMDLTEMSGLIYVLRAFAYGFARIL